MHHSERHQMDESDREFDKLLKRRKEFQNLFDTSFRDLKYLFLQQFRYETELMKSFYFQDENNPTHFVSKTLSNLSASEKQLIVETLEDKNKDRRLYDKSTSSLIARNRKFSTSWATPAFRKALSKCKLSINSRHLRKFIHSNADFIKLTEFDERVLVDFLDEHFFFETNLCRWVFNKEDIVPKITPTSSYLLEK